MLIVKERLRYLGLLILAVFFIPLSVAAAQIGFVKSNIWASKTTALVGEKVTIFAVIVNSEDNILEGKVEFLDDGTGAVVGAPTAFSLSGGGTSNVMSSIWTAVVGSHRFKAKIIEAVNIDRTGKRTPVGSEILSEVTDVVTVLVDTDHDGVPDVVEVKNGTNPNNPDTDHDGVPDGKDLTPLDPDTDHDGIPDKKDTDIDNDGLYNWQETGKASGTLDSTGTMLNGALYKPTDPQKYDTDGDVVSDKEDYYPLDPKRWKKEDDTAAVVPTDETGGGTNNTQTTVSAGSVPATGEVLGEKVVLDTQARRSGWNFFSMPVWAWALVLIWILLLVFLAVLYPAENDIELPYRKAKK